MSATVPMGPRTGDLKAAALAGLIVCGIVCVVHWPALSARALCFDDNQYVEDNALVGNPSWSSAWRFLSEVRDPSTVRGYYQPLSMISLMLDAAMGGSPTNPRPFHRTSLALHVLNSALVAILFFSLFRRAWLSVVVALLFGLHPLTVEPIPWIGERKTLLAAFFALSSLTAYVRFARSGRAETFVACVVLYVLGALSKPTSLPLPLAMMLLDVWPLRRLSRRAVVEKIPLLILAAAFCLVIFDSQRSRSSAAAPGEYPLGQMPLILCHNHGFYLGKILYPTNLSPFYPFPSPLTPSNDGVLVGIVLTAAIVIVLVASLNRAKAPMVAWLVFLVMLAPAMGAVRFSPAIACDKYAYLPLVGGLLLIAWLLDEGWRKAGGLGRTLMIGLAAVAVGLEVRSTRRQYDYWRDSESLFRRMVTLAPASSLPRLGLGSELLHQGRVDEAIDELREAVRLDPNDYQAHAKLGAALIGREQWIEAAEHLRRVLAHYDDDAISHCNLGVALAGQGRMAEAEGEYVTALRRRPRYAAALRNLGVLRVKQGRFDEAASLYEESVRINPADWHAHYDLAVLAARLGQTDRAIEHYRAAIRLMPDDLESQNNLAVLLAESGRLDDAISILTKALMAHPSDAETHNNLAIMLRSKGRLNDAAEHLRTAIRLRPNYADAHFNLGRLLSDQGQSEEAKAEYRAALRVEPNHEAAREALRAASQPTKEPHELRG